MIRRLAALSLALAVLFTTGCSATVHLEPAAQANDPLCADVSVRLPQAIGELDRRWTDAQATGAWGTPTAVIVSCGLEPPGPTTLQCVTFGGVDWIVDDAELPNLRITTYGRTPAVQAYVDTSTVSADTVLQALATAVTDLPVSTQCIAADAVTPESSGAPETDAG